MNVEKLLRAEVQGKVRKLIHMIIIEEGLFIKDVMSGSGLSYTTVFKFLNKGGDVGLVAMRKLLHFICSRSRYKLADIIDEA